MAVNAATGFTQLSGTAVPNQLWAKKTQVKFYDASTFTAITNTDFSGEITNMGDKVTIRTTPDITIFDYQKGAELSKQLPEPSTLDLTVDKAKAFNFIVDDIDKFQADYDFINDWSTDASEQMRVTIDADGLQGVVGTSHASNRGATAGVNTSSYDLGAAAAPVTLMKSNILDYIVDLGSVLDEQNVPESNRFLVLPPWACGLIKKSDLKDASLAGDGTSIMRNGLVGMIDRFKIYRSNQLKTATEGSNLAHYILAGHTTAICFASQLTKVENLQSESTFGTLFRGLNVYGYKTVKPESLAELYAVAG